MAITARLGKWERRRPLVFALLALLTATWFAYDGWYGWPQADNALVRKMLHSRDVSPADRKKLKSWPKGGWFQASTLVRRSFDRLVYRSHFSGWHSVIDIKNQRRIVMLLAVVFLGAIAWYIAVRRRRIVADESGLLLGRGPKIPWNDIVRIDNSHWRSHGEVTIAYRSSGDTTRQARLDGVAFENLPLLLNEVAARAVKAQIVPPAPGNPV